MVDSPHPVPSGRRRPEPLHPLTSLRFFAALMVLLAHFVAPRLTPDAGALYNFTTRGGAGVDLFFVLSGFILMYVYVGASGAEAIDRRAFWIARFARVYPVFALALALDLLPTIIHAHRLGLTFSPGYLVAFGIAKVTLLTSWYPAFVKSPAYIDMGWTLSVEAFFYLLFPFVAGRFLRASPRRLLTFTLACGFASWALRNGTIELWERFPAMRRHDTTAIDWYLHFPPLRLPDFLAGMALGRLFCLRRALDLPRLSPILLPASLLTALGILAFAPASTDWNAWPMMAMDLALGGVVFALAEAEGAPRKWLSHPFAILLGEASYSMYLLHGVVFDALKKGLELVHRDALLDDPRAAILPIVATVLVSIPVYRYVETPARQWIRTWSMRRGPQPAK